ncbi:MAG: ATP-dependent Clp protease ATP-binding subunit ClpX [Dehalococcoidia bacterium]|nr:ATP-dependent Clp protease ATP-binding subunit ClpX [Dehalococcoidia bacterium]MSQ16923.1 ATP-dependent Clp protease ATP-binding subunit ClpX [Dehalococcoidia bacterium]
MANARNSSSALPCSFCEKAHTRANLIMAGQGRAAVCYDCVRVLGQLIEGEAREKPRSQSKGKKSGLLVPREIYNSLDAYVVGQERAKKTLSVAVYNHFKRVLGGGPKSDVELQKANILLVGPTGCGKTLLAETLARTLDVPFAVCDATSLTESGYVGEDVENILLRLIQVADWDVSAAERGIIYIDELDKIARKEGINRSITRDVSGEGVQQELLKIIEGCVANVPPQGGRKHPYQEFLQINTRNILFICGGTFEGLGDIVSRRLASGSSRLGFLAGTRNKEVAETNVLAQAIPQDLMEFGLIPELVGRLPVMASLDSLDREGLIKVLTQPKNAILKQYQQLFKMDGVALEFTPAALDSVAEHALRHRTGARSLRYIVEESLMNVMYEMPSLEGVVRCVVDRDAIDGDGTPTLVTATGETISVPQRALRKSA